MKVTLVPAVVPKRTLEPLVKPVPVMATRTPPVVAPEVGLSEVTVGGVAPLAEDRVGTDTTRAEATTIAPKRMRARIRPEPPMCPLSRAYISLQRGSRASLLVTTAEE